MPIYKQPPNVKPELPDTPWKPYNPQTGIYKQKWQPEYQQTYWENPRTVARYWNWWKAQPPDQAIPTWLNTQKLDAAYQYFRYANKNAPWWEWKYLHPEDPARQYLQSIDMPPWDVLYPSEAKRAVEEQARAGMPELDLTKIPAWQRALVETMSTPYAMGAATMAPWALLGGATGFAAGGPIGAAIGAATPLALGAGLGLASDPAFYQLAVEHGADPDLMGWAQGTAENALRLLNLPAEYMEMGTGATAQLLGAAIDPKAYGRLKDLATSEGVAGALQAGRSTYNVTPTELTNVFPWVEGLLTGKEMQYAGKGEVWKLPEQLPSGEWKYYPEPVKLEPGEVDGLAALVEARRRILGGDRPEDVTKEVSDKYGLSGQFRELVYQSGADPLNIVHIPERAALGFAGKLFGEPGLTLAADVAKGEGALGTLNKYREFLLSGLAGKTAKDISLMGPLTRWWAGVNKAGIPAVYNKPKVPGRYPWYSQTAESRAWEVLGMAHDNAAVLFDASGPEPADIVQAGRAWANTPIEAAAEYSMASLGAPYGYSLALMLKDFFGGDTSPAMEQLAVWEATAPNRMLLNEVAQATGLEPGAVIERLRDAESMDALATEFSDAAKAITDAGQGTLTNAAKQGQINPEMLGQLAKVYIEGDAPYHPEMFKRELMASMIDYVEKWAVDHYGLKPDSTVYRLAETMKAAQSLVFLGLNPTYLVNNFINGEVVMAADGAWRLYAPGEIPRFLEKFGIEPFRLRAGIGFAGLGEDITALPVGQRIRKATTPTGKITEVQRGLRTARDKVGVFSKWAQDVEKWQSERAFVSGMKGMWSRLWRRGVGFEQMPPALEARLASIDRRLPSIVYSIVENGLGGEEIYNRLFGNVLHQDVERYIDDVSQELNFDPEEIREILGEAGAIDILNEGLRTAKNTDEINQLFDGIDKRIQDFLNEQVTGEARARAEQAAQEVARAAGEGKAQALKKIVELFDEVDLDTFIRWNEQYIRWAETFDRAGRIQDRDAKNLMFEVAFSNSDGEWKRIRAWEMATYDGVIQGMKAAGVKTPRGFMANLKNAGETWDGFYKLRRELLRAYFDADESSRGSFDEVQAQISKAYDEAFEKVAGLRGAMDKAIAKMAEDEGGAEFAERVIAYREKVADIRQAMAAAIVDFRKSLAEMGSIPANTRRGLWHKFINDDLGPLMQEFYRIKIEGRHDLASEIGPTPDVPTWMRTPAPGALLDAYATLLKEYKLDEFAKLLRELPNINEHIPQGQGRFTIEELRTGPSYERLGVLSDSLSEIRRLGELAEKRVKEAQAKAEAERTKAQESEYEARTERVPEQEFAPRTMDQLDPESLRAEGWKRGLQALFYAVNADRRLIGLDPYEDMSMVPLDEAVEAMRKRLKPPDEGEAAAPAEPPSPPAPLPPAGEGGKAAPVVEEAPPEEAGMVYRPDEVKLTTKAESYEAWDKEIKLFINDAQNSAESRPHDPSWLNDKMQALTELRNKHRAEWKEPIVVEQFAEWLDSLRGQHTADAYKLGEVKVTLPFIPYKPGEKPKVKLSDWKNMKYRWAELDSGEYAGEKVWAAGFIAGIGEPPFGFPDNPEVTKTIGPLGWYAEQTWVTKIEYGHRPDKTTLNVDQVRMTDEAGKVVYIDRDVYQLARSLYPDATPTLDPTKIKINLWRDTKLVSTWMGIEINKEKDIHIWWDTGYQFTGVPDRIGQHVYIARGEMKGRSGVILEKIEGKTPKYKLQLSTGEIVTRKLQDLTLLNDGQIPGGKMYEQEQADAWHKWNGTLRVGSRVNVAFGDGTLHAGTIDSFWATWPHGFAQANVKLDDGDYWRGDRGVLRPLEVETTEQVVTDAVAAIRDEAVEDALMTAGTEASPGDVRIDETPIPKTPEAEPEIPDETIIPGPAETDEIHWRVYDELRAEVERLKQENAGLKIDQELGIPLYVHHRDEVARAPAVVAVDVQGLKWVNDTFGFESGNVLLKAFVDAVADAHYKAYRVGGDEFVITARSMDDAARAAEDIRIRFNDAIIVVEDANGNQILYKGFDIYTGAGEDFKSAYAGVDAAKRAYREQYTEASRGAQPATVRSVEQPGAGEPGGEGIAAGEPGLPEVPGAAFAAQPSGLLKAYDTFEYEGRQYQVGEIEVRDGEVYQVHANDLTGAYPIGRVFFGGQIDRLAEQGIRFEKPKVAYSGYIPNDPITRVIRARTYAILMEHPEWTKAEIWRAFGDTTQTAQRAYDIEIGRLDDAHGNGADIFYALLDDIWAKWEGGIKQQALEAKSAREAAAAEPTPATPTQPGTKAQRLIDALSKRFEYKGQINEIAYFLTNKEFEDFVTRLGIDLDNELDVNLAYDALEGAFNKIVRMLRADMEAKNLPLAERLNQLATVEAQLTKARRTLAKKKLQQFSTPFTISEAAGVAADVRGGDTILEPTAGTANLVEKFQNRGDIRVIVNEIDAGRLDVLRALGYEPTNYDVLSADWVVDVNRKRLPPLANVLIENPPWGAYSKGIYGKPTNIPVKGMNDWSQRFYYLIDQRLAQFGRTVAVAPTNWLYVRSRTTGEITQAGTAWLDWLKGKNWLRAVIESPPDAYKHRGTGVGSLLVVVDKMPKAVDLDPIMAWGDNAPKTWDEYAVLVEQLAAGGTHARTELSVRNGQSTIVEGQGIPARGLPGGDRRGEQTGAGAGAVRPSVVTEEAGTVPGAPGMAGVPGEAGAGARPALPETPGGVELVVPGPAGPGGYVQPERFAGEGEAVSDSGMVARVPGGSRAERKGARAVVPTRGARALAERSQPYREQATADIQRSDGYSLSTFVGQGGISPHPRPLVEASPLAGVPGPDVSGVEVHADVWDANARGMLSDDQRQAVIQIANAIEKGHAIIVADGTGVGKGREVMATAMDWLGRNLANRILVTTKSDDNVSDLFEEAWGISQGKYSDDGSEYTPGEYFISPTTGEKYTIIDVKKYDTDSLPEMDRAIYISTYDQMKKFKDTFIARIRFDGWLADEAHIAKNVFGKNGNGNGAGGDASEYGRTWTQLHSHIMARDGKIAYFTATPAEQVSQLAYLWGLEEWGIGPSAFDAWMRYVSGALDDAEYQRLQIEADIDPFRDAEMERLVNRAKDGVGEKVRIMGERDYKDVTFLADSRYGYYRIGRTVGVVAKHPMFRGMAVDVAKMPSERLAKALAQYLTDTYPAADRQTYSDLVSDFEHLGQTSAARAGAISDAQIEIVNNTRINTRDISGVGFTPAFIEQIMRELKAKGKFMSRELWRGELEYDIKLSPKAGEFFYSDTYVQMVNLFQEIERNYKAFGRLSNSNKTGRSYGPNGNIQNFMRQLIGNVLMRDALDEATAYIDQGMKPVLSLNYISELDPDNGNLNAALNTISTRMVITDAEGKVVYDPNTGEVQLGAEIPEAIMEIERLRATGQELFSQALELIYGNDPGAAKYLEGNILPSPIQQIIDRFGRENVSLITGEAKGVFANGQKLGKPNTKAEMKRFMQGKTQVGVISPKGGTGISLHDKYGNGRRVMIFVDYDWTGSEIMQRIGRVDRADQKSSPLIKFLNLPQAIHRKTLSTVAARMNSLGATSRGGSHAVGASEFSESMDLSSDYFGYALRYAWENDFSRELRAAFPWRDERGQVPRLWPNKTTKDFLLRIQQFMHPDLADEAFNLWMKATEQLQGTQEYQRHMERLSTKTSGEILRNTDFKRPDDLPLGLYEVKGDDGKIYGVLSGVFLDNLKRIRQAMYSGRMEEGLSGITWVAFQDHATGKTVSGIRIGPMQLDRVAKLFGESLTAQITPGTAVEALKANHKIKVQGPGDAEWTLRQRKDGRFQLDGTKESQGQMLVDAGAKKHVSGFYWIPEDAVEPFLNRFRIIQEGVPEELLAAKRPYYARSVYGWKELDVQEIFTLENYPGVEFVIHRSETDQYWIVTEARSGLQVTYERSIEAAKRSLTDKLRNYSDDEFKTLIEQSLRDRGESPHYTSPEQDMGTALPRPGTINRETADQHYEFLAGVEMGEKIVGVTPFQHGDWTISAIEYHDRLAVAYVPAGYDGVGQSFDTARGPARLLGVAPDNPGEWVYQVGDELKRMPVIQGGAEEGTASAQGMPNVPAYRFLGRAQDELYHERVRPVLEGLRERLTDPRATLPESKLGNLDPVSKRELLNYLRRLKGQMADTKLAAIRSGEMKRDMALLNYSKRYGFDTPLTAIYPYQFFYTRSMKNWAIRALEHPSWLALYARLRNFQHSFEREGFPLRLRDKIRIPLPFLPDWMGGGLWVDPMRQTFPFEMLLRPFQQMIMDQSQVEQRAKVLVQRWTTEGQISQTDASQALALRSGAIWNRAMATAKNEIGSEISNPFDFANLIVAPSLPIQVGYNLLRGTPEKISTMPITRGVQALTAAAGMNQGRGYNLEGPIRRKLGLPEFGEWTDYRIDRQLSNLAAEGIPVGDILLAMNERQGDLFVEAQRRAAQEMATSTLGGYAGLPANLLPDSELKLRGLKDDFDAAMSAFRMGDDSAAREFFDEHPEYEARLALYDTPEQRLRQFLVSQVWENYLALGGTHKEQVREAFGDVFTDAFLNQETRSYDSISVNTLARWAQALGGRAPQQVAPAEDDIDFGKLELAPDWIAEAVDTYRQERNANFPNWYAVQQRYFALPKGAARRAYLGQFPWLKDYWDWAREYKAAHPEIVDFVSAPESQAQSSGGSSGVISYSSGSTLLPVIYRDDKIIIRPGSIPFEMQRKLKEYGFRYDGGAWTGPDSIQNRRIIKRYFGSGFNSRAQLNLKELSPVLITQIMQYYYTGKMGEGTQAELRRIWKKSGEPGGSFKGWVNDLVMGMTQ